MNINTIANTGHTQLKVTAIKKVFLLMFIHFKVLWDVFHCWWQDGFHGCTSQPETALPVNLAFAGQRS